ncbi:MAG: aminotransferase class I/II-fold pyridoxal phosphate-dependent enzyme [Gemmatimonadales bacterium]
MTFQIFELERWQSEWEHRVEYNLADSSVRGARLREILSPPELDGFLNLELGYPMVNGTVRLRERIARLYHGAEPDQVLVTVGGAEANLLACETLLGPGDRVAVMEPGYRQVYGIAANRGATVLPFSLDPDAGWRPRLDQLDEAARGGLKAIALVNPNNPTGSILSAAERGRIVEIAERTGAWILADEVYTGTERHGHEETPSFWGQAPRVIAVSSLSKAYGLAGLRLGWLLAPRDLVPELWRRHEYDVIAAAAPSMRLAELALEPETRSRLIDRQRELSRQGWTVMERWLARYPDLLSVGASSATSIAFVRYRLPEPSVAVADRIRRDASVLVAPGAYLGAEHHLRITHGLGADYVTPALERIGRVLEALAAKR